MFSQSSESNLRRLVIESKMFPKNAELDPNFDLNVTNAITYLKLIFQSEDLINVFRLKEDDNGKDIELALLRAICNSKQLT